MGILKFSIENETVPVPVNGNLVPTHGLQAITNTSEALAYFANVYQNIHSGVNQNFGGILGVQPLCRMSEEATEQGDEYMQIIAYVPLKKNWRAFPNGGMLHKQVLQRLADNKADDAVNFVPT